MGWALPLDVKWLYALLMGGHINSCVLQLVMTACSCVSLLSMMPVQ